MRLVLCLGVGLLACRPTPLPAPPVAAAPHVIPPPSVPGDARAHYLEAAIAVRRGELEHAETAYRWVTRLDATSPWPWLALGRFLERQRRWDEALGAYERAVSNAPDLGEAHLAAGSSLVRSGQPERGLTYLRTASELGLPQGHHLYARALTMTGQRDVAMGVLEQWLTGSVSIDDVFDRARLSYELGFDDAVVDDLVEVDWLFAPTPAGDLFLDAAARSCRLGDVWVVARGQAFAARSNPAWTQVAARIAERVGDPYLLMETDPDTPAGVRA